MDGSGLLAKLVDELNQWVCGSSGIQGIPARVVVCAAWDCRGAEGLRLILGRRFFFLSPRQRSLGGALAYVEPFGDLNPRKPCLSQCGHPL
jgi:hypothetical protein